MSQRVTIYNVYQPSKKKDTKRSSTPYKNDLEIGRYSKNENDS